MNDYLKPFL